MLYILEEEFRIFYTTSKYDFIPTLPTTLSSFLFGGSNDQDPLPEIQQQISGCEVNGNIYETGAIVEESSGPCLQCR